MQAELLCRAKTDRISSIHHTGLLSHLGMRLAIECADTVGVFVDTSFTSIQFIGGHAHLVPQRPFLEYDEIRQESLDLSYTEGKSENLFFLCYRFTVA